MDGRGTEVLPGPPPTAVGWATGLLAPGRTPVAVLRLLVRIAPVTVALVGAVLLAADRPGRPDHPGRTPTGGGPPAGNGEGQDGRTPAEPSEPRP